MDPVLEAITGSRSAAQVMLFLQAYGSGYGAWIARTYDAPLTAVQRQLVRLEANGVLVSQPVGRTRVFEFNTRIPTVRDLRVFLQSVLDGMPDDELKAFYRQRHRPRRTAKGD